MIASIVYVQVRIISTQWYTQKSNKYAELGIVRMTGSSMVMQFKNMCVKELLPLDLLESLMRTKGRALWDLVMGISLPPR